MSNGLDPDQDRVMSVLIWVQTVCKGYWRMIEVATSRERVNKKFCNQAILEDLLPIVSLYKSDILTNKSNY